MIINHLIGVGTPTQQASVMVGGNGGTFYTAAGNSQTTATPTNGGTVAVSICSTSGKGVQLPQCDPCSEIFVWNGGSNTLYVYGQSGENIGSGAANAFFAIPTKKSAILKKVSATQWAQNLSA